MNMHFRFAKIIWGLCAMQLKQYNQALEHFNNGLNWRQKLNIEEYYGHSYQYIAECHSEMGNPDTAKYYYQQALLYGQKGLKTELIRCHMSYGRFLVKNDSERFCPK
jgi:tetratricopeptide (TPR) repeat protein